MVAVAVVGASGYAARETIELLLQHPHAELVAVTSREAEGDGAAPLLADLHPRFRQRCSLRCQAFSPQTLAEQAECIFVGLPHGASMAAVRPLLECGVRVIDLSADYRLRDPEIYRQWYGETHADTTNLAHAVYGLPELFGDRIASAQLIANPGCYPSSAILALAPLLAAGWVQPTDLIVDSKSGVSGAGRSPKLTTHYPECNESVSAYAVGRHRHTPEIEQILTQATGAAVEVLFTPHQIPMDRGILSTIYASPTSAQRGKITEAMVRDRLREFYAGQPFIRIVEQPPNTKDTVGTNFCDIYATVVRHRVLLIACLDNLIKGAAGAAVQNFNRMFGFPETTGFF